MANTHDNLKEAFAGESQAFQKYTSFAEAAEKEGLPNIARLFRTTAQAERLHAAGHFAALDGVGSTLDNLKAAIGGETYEFEQMYPPMLAQAEAEGHKAKRMFKYAVEAEEVHARLYALALAAAQQGQDLAETNFYLCPVCGHIEFGTPPAKCPICGVAAAKFVQV
ncbi:MAG TPA: rubrerythrin family protein [Candidatus Krumholzibacteria bacterium]|nr:rubrerythrin family protein [Candidatus Krumholzibacteria bacterium]